jgi:HEAT repeat protein
MKGKTCIVAMGCIAFFALGDLAAFADAPAATAAGPQSSQTATPAASAAATTPAPAATMTEAEKNSKRRDVLRYGIESEITDLLKTLDAEKETAFNEDILALFEESHNAKLKSSILAFFSDIEAKIAERDALDIVTSRDKEDKGLVTASLLYLGQIRSKDALSFAPVIIKEDDKKLLPAVIKLLGRAGGPDEEDLLLKWMSSDAPSEDLKQSAIQALGDFGSGKAADALMKIVADSEQGKATRMYACDALGKIKDDRAIPSLLTAADSDDPNVRSSALGALSHMPGKDASNAVASGLKDSTPAVRVAACRAAASMKLASAIPALVYKAKNDPEKSVKIEAFKSLAEIGGPDGFGFLRDFFGDAKNDSALRILAFNLLMRKDASSIPMLRDRLIAESKEKDRSLFTAFVREISGAQDAASAAPLARVLLSDSDYLIRIGAIEWARKTKAPDFKADIAAAAAGDASDYVRKKAAEVLALYK